MNILQAHKFYWHRDGASNYCLYLSSLLSGAGHSVVPFSMKDPRNLPSRYSDFFVSPMDISNPRSLGLMDKLAFGARMLYSLEAEEKMADLLKAEKINIAHLHNIYHHISPSILPLLKKNNIPVVMTLHDYNLLSPNYSLYHHGAIHEEDASGWHLSCLKNKCVKNSASASTLAVFESVFQNKIMRYYEKNVDLFLAPSKFIMDKFVEHGWPREKIVRLPLPVDMNKFSVQPADMGYVVYSGRLSEEKGLNVLLEAAKLTPDIDYKIIGTGALSDYLENKIQIENISNVELVGFKASEELNTLLSGARLMVLPSVWYENYPISILEAKALGKPVVASDIGGIPELLPKELLVKPGDPAALAEKISFWFNKSETDRLSLGAELRKEVERENNPQDHLRAVLKIYKLFLGK